SGGCPVSIPRGAAERTFGERKEAVMKRVTILLLAGLLISACAGIPKRESDAARLDRFMKYAGAPVDHITWLSNYEGWSALGQYQLVLYTNVSDAYLVTVMPPCENLLFANRIGVTQTANTVYAKFDSIKVHHWRCR